MRLFVYICFVAGFPPEALPAGVSGLGSEVDGSVP